MSSGPRSFSFDIVDNDGGDGMGERRQRGEMRVGGRKRKPMSDGGFEENQISHACLYLVRLFLRLSNPPADAKPNSRARRGGLITTAQRIRS